MKGLGKPVGSSATWRCPQGQARSVSSCGYPRPSGHLRKDAQHRPPRDASEGARRAGTSLLGAVRSAPGTQTLAFPHRDPKENGERRARLALPVLPGPLDPKGPLEMTAPKAAL